VKKFEMENHMLRDNTKSTRNDDSIFIFVFIQTLVKFSMDLSKIFIKLRERIFWAGTLLASLEFKTEEKSP